MKRTSAKPPLPPTPALSNWITDSDLEPCSRCGGGHPHRSKYVCTRCNRLFCDGTSRVLKMGRAHAVGYRDGGEIFRTWCGPLDDCGLWDEIAPKLKRIIDDLEVPHE